MLEAFELQGKKVNGIFVNHWDQAINIHTVNHPGHLHLCTGVDDVRIEEIWNGKRTLKLLWGSPACTHHSVARGGKPVSEQQRATAWCLLRYIRRMRPDHILIENVKEFLQWGPCRQKTRDGRPVWITKDSAGKEIETFDIPFRQARGEHRRTWLKRLSEAGYEMALVADKRRAGQEFRRWSRHLRREGYDLDHRVLCSADYGDPTSRRRLFIQGARRAAGVRVVWPNPTHTARVAGMVPAGLRPWRVARDILDFSDLGESIWRRRRPLAPATLMRIAKGFVKYGLPNLLELINGGAFPYVVRMQGKSNAESIDSPVSTITATLKHYFLNPFMIKFRGTNNGADVDLPVPTVTAGGQHLGLVQGYMMTTDQTGRALDLSYSMDEPVRTLVTKTNQAMTHAAMMPLPECPGDRVEVEEFKPGTRHPGDPDGRVAQLLEALVAAGVQLRPFLICYYSSGSEGQTIDEPLRVVTAKARHCLVYPALEYRGGYYQLDFRFRMLSVRELARAQGFTEDYRFPGTQTDAVRAIGNSVSRRIARALCLAATTQQSDITPYLETAEPIAASAA